MPRLACLAAALLCLPVRLGAQSLPGLPAWRPINPLVESRTALGFEPVLPAGAPRTSVEVLVDYASIIESQRGGATDTYLFDAELHRTALRVTRRVGRRAFVRGELTVNSAWRGAFDSFFNWWHNVFGFRMPERDNRPLNQFAYDLRLDGVASPAYGAAGAYLGDARLGAGLLLRPGWQLLATVTLPTATAEGYGRGTVGSALLSTVRLHPHPRIAWESSAGAGFTPSRGALAPVQREFFASASTGARWRFWGRQSLYVNYVVTSPLYRDTGIRALDRVDMALDFGWLLQTKRGGEWRIGLVEDPLPSGPGIDLVVRLGAAF